jgi:hypothetical protein
LDGVDDAGLHEVVGHRQSPGKKDEVLPGAVDLIGADEGGRQLLA